METSRADECLFLESTLSRVSAELNALLSQKARLSRRLNDLRSHTHSLPVETLSTILEHACLGKHERSALASVCSHWHRVVHTTPPLWTSVSLPSYLRPNSTNLLLYYHKKARGFPLAVTLHPVHSRSTGPRDQERILPVFRTLLQDISHHLRSLSLCGIDPLIWPLIEGYASANCAFPQLEELMLSFFDGMPKMEATSPLFSSARLTSVRLIGAAAGFENRLPMENVTSFDGGMGYATDGIRILLRYPQIMTFRWQALYGIENNEHNVPMSSSSLNVVVASLKTLVWRGGDGKIVARLMQRLRFPSLHHLQWYPSAPRLHDYPGYPDFSYSFFSSMRQLRSLQFDLNTDTRNLLSCVPSVVDLEVECVGSETSGNCESFLLKMGSTSNDCLLPHLKIMTLLLKRTPVRSELDELVRMLSSRSAHAASRCTRLEQFTLRIQTYGDASSIKEVWQEHHIHSFHSLRQGGLKLQIWENKHNLESCAFPVH